MAETLTADIKPQDIAAVDPWYWADLNKIELHSGTFELTGHEPLVEFMQDSSKEKCCIKATQAGYTSAEMLNTLHGLIHQKYPQGVFYLFPTSDDVTEFSKSRFNPLIDDNECIRRYVRSTDTANLKKVGRGFLYLRGARLNQRVRGQAKESSKLRSAPADKVVYDEFDLMDESVREKARSRMAHSNLQEEVWLSNPTIPDYGIDKIYQRSDQRHWLIKCKCGRWVDMNADFPDCLIERLDGSVYRGCYKCGEPVKVTDGMWVKKHPENERAGWWWSQLLSIFRKPKDILAEYRDVDTNIADFHRFTLGRAYIESENRLTRAQVYACCGRDAVAMNDYGPCAMGVDVGKNLHVVIGKRVAADQYKILKTAEVPDWKACHDLARRFNVRCEVQDMYPETHRCREYQQAEKHEVWLCQYSESLSTGDHFNHQTGVVTVNRTEVCDRTHNLVITPGRLELPVQCGIVDEYVRQMCETAKIPERDEMSGVVKYRYQKLGDDHFRHATNYFLIASQRVAPVMEKGDLRRNPAVAGSSYSVLG